MLLPRHKIRYAYDFREGHHLDFGLHLRLLNTCKFPSHMLPYLYRQGSCSRWPWNMTLPSPRLKRVTISKYYAVKPHKHNSTADDWLKVLSLRTLLVRSVQHLVTYTKMFFCMSSFRIRLMTSSLMSTNRVTALEPYIPIITDY